MTAVGIPVTLRLLQTSEGGRRSPIRNGYSAVARFGHDETDFGFVLSMDRDELAPGDEASGTVEIWAGEYLPHLEPGAPFEVREGPSVVGRGVISSRDIRER